MTRQDQECHGFYLKWDYYPYYGGKFWGLYYHESCFSALTVFETLKEARHFCKRLKDKDASAWSYIQA